VDFQGRNDSQLNKTTNNISTLTSQFSNCAEELSFCSQFGNVEIMTSSKNVFRVHMEKPVLNERIDVDSSCKVSERKGVQ